MLFVLVRKFIYKVEIKTLINNIGTLINKHLKIKIKNLTEYNKCLRVFKFDIFFNVVFDLIKVIYFRIQGVAPVVKG